MSGAGNLKDFAAFGAWGNLYPQITLFSADYADSTDLFSIVRLGFCKNEISFDALENLLVAQAFQPVPEQPGAAVPHFL